MARMEQARRVGWGWTRPPGNRGPALQLLHRRAGGEPVGLSDQGPRRGAGVPVLITGEDCPQHVLSVTA